MLPNPMLVIRWNVRQSVIAGIIGVASDAAQLCKVTVETWRRTIYEPYSQSAYGDNSFRPDVLSHFKQYAHIRLHDEVFTYSLYFIIFKYEKQPVIAPQSEILFRSLRPNQFC